MRREPRGRLWEVFVIFLRLGLTSFGGPVAHLGYFRETLVRRRAWVDESTYAQIVALCQFLPGPASSQVGIILGSIRAGAGGGIAAWLGFTLPSAIGLTVFALGARNFAGLERAPWMHGLLIAAVAVVAQAVAVMSSVLAPDRIRRTIAVAVAIALLLLPTAPYTQLLAILCGAALGIRFLRATGDEPAAAQRPLPGSRRTALAGALAFAGLLAGLPAAVRLWPHFGPAAVFSNFFAAGALVFGGGHVVLPLLQARTVTPGWISADSFLAGYGAAQAVPGPLFSFAAYVGAAMTRGPVSGVGGAALALVAIYLPSFLLIVVVMPFWNGVQRNRRLRSAVNGANASVVGLLLAALYSPVWVNAVHSKADVALVLSAYLLLAVWKVPPPLVVALSAASAEALSRL